MKTGDKLNVDHTENYVYLHIDPRDKQVMYVGMGQRHRAWVCGRASNSRHEDHGDWMDELISLGYTPDEWVHIVDQNLPRKKALKLEKMLIEQYGYDNLFNQDMRRPSKMTHDQIKASEDFRREGMSYSKIAEEIGLSAMTIWRNLNK